jgi:hypothetical protein
MVTRIIGKEDLNASTVPYKSYKINAQVYNIINKVSNIKDKDFGGMRGLALITTMLASSHLDAC